MNIRYVESKFEFFLTICIFYCRGFYPKGGGIVEVQVEPVKILSAVNLIEFGSVTRVWGRSYVAGVLPADVRVVY